MAGGIDWFRWHHGSVTDQKFGLIGRKAGASVAEVIAVWACLLEAASAAEERGILESTDFEAMDFALGMDDGKSKQIYTAMVDRNLIDQYGHIVSWPKRQPKREREDDTAADRKRRQREREAEQKGVIDGVTPCHTMSHQETPRGEERREELNLTTPVGVVVGNGVARPDCPHQEIIAAYHAALPMGMQVRVWSGARVKHLQARWREDQKRQSIEWWQRFFGYVAKSQFLTGRAPSARDRDPFVVSLDWLVSPQNFAKVIEGKYHRETT